MAIDTFVGTAATGVATHNPAWTANPSNDGLTSLQLDGSGNLVATGFNFCDAYYNGGGTGTNSISHITMPAGTTIDALGNFVGCGARTHATQLGYQCYPHSTSNVNTNWDQVGVRRNGGAGFITYVAITPFNLNTTPGNLSIRISGVDIIVTANGVDYTSGLAGTGGNDVTGAAVLTGGFPSVLIYRNSNPGTPLSIDTWTDDVPVGGVMRPAAGIGSGGMSDMGGGMQGKRASNRIFVPTEFRTRDLARFRARPELRA